MSTLLLTLLLHADTLLGWCKTVERVLAESDLIRKESDDVGPSTELDYWKARMAKFNRYVSVSVHACVVVDELFIILCTSPPFILLVTHRGCCVPVCSITDQLKLKDFQIVLSVLKVAKSKFLKRWTDLDVRITDAANEAKVPRCACDR